MHRRIGHAVFTFFSRFPKHRIREPEKYNLSNVHSVFGNLIDKGIGIFTILSPKRDYLKIKKHIIAKPIYVAML